MEISLMETYVESLHCLHTYITMNG